MEEGGGGGGGGGGGVKACVAPTAGSMLVNEGPGYPLQCHITLHFPHTTLCNAHS